MKHTWPTSDPVAFAAFMLDYFPTTPWLIGECICARVPVCVPVCACAGHCVYEISAWYEKYLRISHVLRLTILTPNPRLILGNESWIDNNCATWGKVLVGNMTDSTFQLHAVYAPERSDGGTSVGDAELTFSSEVDAAIEDLLFHPFLDFNVGMYTEDLDFYVERFNCGGVSYLPIQWTDVDGNDAYSLMVKSISYPSDANRICSQSITRALTTPRCTSLILLSCWRSWVPLSLRPHQRSRRRCPGFPPRCLLCRP